MVSKKTKILIIDIGVFLVALAILWSIYYKDSPSTTKEELITAVKNHKHDYRLPGRLSELAENYQDNESFEVLCEYGLNSEIGQFRQLSIYLLEEYFIPKKQFYLRSYKNFGERLLIEEDEAVIGILIYSLCHTDASLCFQYYEKALSMKRFQKFTKDFLGALFYVKDDRSVEFISRYINDIEYNIVIAGALANIDSKRSVAMMVKLIEPIDLFFSDKYLFMYYGFIDPDEKNNESHPTGPAACAVFFRRHAGTDFGILDALRKNDIKLFKESIDKVKKWWKENKDKFPDQILPESDKKNEKVLNDETLNSLVGKNYMEAIRILGEPIDTKTIEFAYPDDSEFSKEEIDQYLEKTLYKEMYYKSFIVKVNGKKNVFAIEKSDTEGTK